VKVRAAVFGRRNELPVTLDAGVNALPELGQQMCHIPAAPTASTEDRVRADEAGNPSSFGSNVQPRPPGIAPVRASIGSGSCRASRGA